MTWRHVVSVSGGKDSTATYLHALARGVDFQPVFADTGNEHEATYEFVRRLPELTGGPEITWVRADFTNQIARKRTIVAEHWPAALMAGRPGRWLPHPGFTELWTESGWEIPPEPPEPTEPWGDYETSFYRWEPGRAALTESAALTWVERTLEILHPTGNPFLDLCLWKGRAPSVGARFCTGHLKIEPIEREMVAPPRTAGHTVISWMGVRAEESIARRHLPVLQNFSHIGTGPGRHYHYRPIHKWTLADVLAIHRRFGVPLNPLYLMGFDRCGCMPCILAKKREIALMARVAPEHVERIRGWEALIGLAAKYPGLGAFFGSDKTPEGRADKFGPIPGIDTIVAWAQTGRGGRQYDLALDAAEAFGTVCSAWGACE